MYDFVRYSTLLKCRVPSEFTEKMAVKPCRRLSEDWGALPRILTGKEENSKTAQEEEHVPLRRAGR